MSSSCRNAAISRCDFVSCSWSEAMRARAVGRSSMAVSRARVGAITASYDRNAPSVYSRPQPSWSRDALIPAAAAGLCDIDAEQQKRKIRAAHRHGVAQVRHGPRERAALESLVEHPKPAVIPGENFETVAASIAKEKQMPRQGIEIEALTYQRGEPVDRAAQIGRAGRHVDANRGRQR